MMRLPDPLSRYDHERTIRTNQALVTEDLRNRKIGADVELVNERLILRSPNGSRYQIKVDNSGNLSTTGPL